MWYSGVFFLFRTKTILRHNNQPRSDYTHGAYGEQTHFVYCFLQKIRTTASLPVVERWENSMLPNNSSFAPIEEEQFLVGTRVHEAFKKTRTFTSRRSSSAVPVVFFRSLLEMRFRLLLQVLNGAGRHLFLS